MISKSMKSLAPMKTTGRKNGQQGATTDTSKDQDKQDLDKFMSLSRQNMINRTGSHDAESRVSYASVTGRPKEQMLNNIRQKLHDKYGRDDAATYAIEGVMARLSKKERLGVKVSHLSTLYETNFFM